MRIRSSRRPFALLRGVKPPTSWVEGRVHKMLRDDLVILATLNDEKAPWTWVRPQGKGWVYYTSSGHDTRVWNDSGFQGPWVQVSKWVYSATMQGAAVERSHRNLKATLPSGAQGDRAAGRDAIGRARIGPRTPARNNTSAIVYFVLRK